MNKKSSDQDYVEMSDQTYQKSFYAFKQGLAEAPAPKNKPYLIAGLTLAGAGIAALLLFVSITDMTVPNGKADQMIIIGDENEDEAEIPTSLNTIEVDADWALDLISRDPYELSVMKSEALHNGEFTVSLSADWTMQEEYIKDGTKTTVTGPNSEKLSILLFDHLSSDDSVLQEAEKILEEHPYTSATRLPYENVQKHFANAEFSQRHDRLGFTIDPHSWFYSFENQEANRFYDLFSSELFGKKILLLADYPLDQPDTWAQTYHFMSNIVPRAYHPYMLDVSEEVSTDGRPLEKEMVTTIDLTDYVSESFELYQNEQLLFSTYIPKESDINKFTHNDFTEWRISTDTSDNQFYSFGLFHSDFDFNKVEDLLIYTYGVSSESIEKKDEETITFDDSTNKISGELKLYTMNNEKYYMYQQKDTSIFQQTNEWRLDQLAHYFLNEMEWK